MIVAAKAKARVHAIVHDDLQTSKEIVTLEKTTTHQAYTPSQAGTAHSFELHQK
jgi:hypothetical protein